MDMRQSRPEVSVVTMSELKFVEFQAVSTAASLEFFSVASGATDEQLQRELSAVECTVPS